MRYIFILGNNFELSKLEIMTILPQAKKVMADKNFLIIDHAEIDCDDTINRLGGTIKIGIILSKNPEFELILNYASKIPTNKRFNFGFSFYNQSPSNIGMKIKHKLKESGISSRLVTSHEPALSSVIVTKEKCRDFIVLPDFFGVTCAVQNFKDYSKRDFGRPASDAFSGMLPPKLAKIMINLAQIKLNKTILDPFCGSGTILTEAMALGYQNLIGTDISEKAVEDTQKNLSWLAKEFNYSQQNIKIKQADVKELSKKIKINSIDSIITEPYLGKPMKGNESETMIKKIIAELEELYLTAFLEFKKILINDGKIIIVIPEWHLRGQIYTMNLDTQLKKLGMTRLDQGNLIYKRENQKIWRNITIWKK